MRRSPAVLLLLLLAASSVATVDPNEQDVLSVDRALNGIDIADATGAFVAVTDDTGGSPDASVWFYWGADGRNLRQDGVADAEDCGLFSQDCTTDATLVAIDRTGERMVVAAPHDGQSTELVFIETASGPVHQTTLTGQAIGLAISDDGDAVAVATDRSVPEDGRIYRFNWGSSVTSWVDNLDDPATAIAMSGDGDAIAAGIGADHARYAHTSATTQVLDTKFPSTVTAVAVANDDDHLSIAGSNNGYFVLYDDGTSKDNRLLRVRDVENAITAVAITEDASAIAIGNSDGDLWVYRVDPEIKQLLNSGQAIDHRELSSGIDDLDFSEDGRNLLVAAGTDIIHYALDGNDVEYVWNTTLANSIGAVRVSADGSRVIAASSTGSTHQIHRYEAERSLHLDLPETVTIAPGASKAVDADFENNGNRPIEPTLQTALPAGLTATMDSVPSRVATDATEAAEVTVQVAPHTAPGTYAMHWNVTADGDLVASEAVDIVVPEQAAWVLEAGDHPRSLAAEPGTNTTFSLDLFNGGNTAQAAPVTATVDADGWTATVRGTLDPTPGTTGSVFVDLLAPAGLAEGTTATATVLLDGAEVVQLTATVGARFEVGLEVPNGLELHPGEPKPLIVHVTNQGNTIDGARIAAIGLPLGWTVQFPTGATHTIPQMSPGERVTVEGFMTAPPTAITGGAPTQLFLRATSVGDTDQAATQRLLVTVSEAPEDDDGDSNPIPGPGAPLILGLGALLVAQRRR